MQDLCSGALYLILIIVRYNGIYIPSIPIYPPNAKTLDPRHRPLLPRIMELQSQLCLANTHIISSTREARVGALISQWTAGRRWSRRGLLLTVVVALLRWSLLLLLWLL